MLIAMGNRTIIKPFKNEDTKTASGIIIALTVQEEYSDSGIVVFSDKYPAGTIVFIPPYAFSKVTSQNEDYFVISTEDILGVIS